jgi:hypothetical protein
MVRRDRNKNSDIFLPEPADSGLGICHFASLRQRAD